MSSTRDNTMRARVATMSTCLLPNKPALMTAILSLASNLVRCVTARNSVSDAASAQWVQFLEPNNALHFIRQMLFLLHKKKRSWRTHAPPPRHPLPSATDGVALAAWEVHTSFERLKNNAVNPLSVAAANPMTWLYYSKTTYCLSMRVECDKFVTTIHARYFHTHVHCQARRTPAGSRAFIVTRNIKWTAIFM